jgi:hypothetical protein
MILMAGQGWATDFYVRPAADGEYGSEDGSDYANAYDGFADIDWTASGVDDDDTLYVCGTFAEMLTIGGSGSASHLITIKKHPSYDAIITGSDVRQYCIYATGKDYITIDGIDTQNAGGSAANYNVYFDSCDYATYNNATSHTTTNDAVIMANDCNYCTVQNVTAYSSGSSNGCQISDYSNNGGVNDHNTITGCTAYSGTAGGICAHGFDDAVPDEVNYSTLSHNVSYSNGTRGISLSLCKNSVAEYNVVHNNAKDGIRASAGNYALAFGDGNIVRYNIVYDNNTAETDSGAITFTNEQNFQCYYNIVYNTLATGRSGIVLAEYVGGSVYNNTIYNMDESPIYLYSYDSGANVLIKNNIMSVSQAYTYGIRVTDDVAGKFTSDYNIANETYFGYIQTGGAKSLADWRTATSQDANSQLADPLFITAGSNFHLTSTSPAIDKGANVSLTSDYDGRTVPYNTVQDIGALEYIPYTGLGVGFSGVTLP